MKKVEILQEEIERMDLGHGKEILAEFQKILARLKE